MNTRLNRHCMLFSLTLGVAIFTLSLQTAPAEEPFAGQAGSADAAGVDAADAAEGAAVDAADAAGAGAADAADAAGADVAATADAAGAGAADAASPGAPPATAPQSPPSESPKKTADEAAVGGADADGTRLRRLHEHLMIDTVNKWVIVDGEVAQREGPLEMFACPKDTKDYESAVAVYSKAFMIHAALLAVGVKPGKPVQFVDEQGKPAYRPASGTRIDVMILWTDEAGKRHKTPAQNWLREFRTKKPMEHHWVFVGSGFYHDVATGERYYLADGGELICVSNFPSAMMDLPIESSQSDEALLYEAFTENMPPQGTKIRLVLMPVREEKKEEE